MWVCAVWMQCPESPEEDSGSPGAGVTGGCDPPDVGDGN